MLVARFQKFDRRHLAAERSCVQCRAHSDYCRPSRSQREIRTHNGRKQSQKRIFLRCRLRQPCRSAERRMEKKKNSNHGGLRRACAVSAELPKKNQQNWVRVPAHLCSLLWPVRACMHACANRLTQVIPKTSSTFFIELSCSGAVSVIDDRLGWSTELLIVPRSRGEELTSTPRRVSLQFRSSLARLSVCDECTPRLSTGNKHLSAVNCDW